MGSQPPPRVPPKDPKHPPTPPPQPADKRDPPPVNWPERDDTGDVPVHRDREGRSPRGGL